MTTTETPTPGPRPVLLNAILGIEKGRRQRVNKRLGELQRQLGRLPQMTGIERTYRATADDDKELLPAESTRVQVRVPDVLNEVAETMTGLLDIVFTRDVGNTKAVADLTVGDVVIARDVPTTYLVFLQKQVEDLLSILKEVPVHDPSEQWSWDPSTSTYRTPERGTTRLKKKPFSFVKAPATDKHAAQVELMTEDRIVGIWNTVKFTGAVPADRAYQLVQRAQALLDGVKMARDQANTLEVEQQRIGGAVFNYLLAP